jgi:hypothetical protein
MLGFLKNQNTKKKSKFAKKKEEEEEKVEGPIWKPSNILL